MIGRLNHVAIAVPRPRRRRRAVFRHAGSRGVASRCRSPSMASPSCSSPCPTPRSSCWSRLGEVADRGLPAAQPGGRHPPSLLRGGRHPRRARPAEGGRRARARRRRAKDRRPRQAGAVPAPQGFQRHAGRARAGLSASMSVPFAIAIYVVIWWTVLFAILPIGVRTQGEDGLVVPGTPASAPTRPRLAARGAPDHAGFLPGVRRTLGGDQVGVIDLEKWLGRAVDARRKKRARPLSLAPGIADHFFPMPHALIGRRVLRNSFPRLGLRGPCITRGLMTFFMSTTLAKPRPSVTP